MSDSTRYGRESLDELRATLEREKIRTSLACLEGVNDFLGFDREINLELLRVVRTVAGGIEANPEDLFRAQGGNLAEVLSALRQQQGGGADITGASLDWIEYVERIVKIFTGPVAEEKRFFLTILRLIFCGC